MHWSRVLLLQNLHSLMFISFEFTFAFPSSLADVEIIPFVFFSSLQGKSSAALNYLRGLGNVIYFYKSQNGTRISPARSCRELHLEHPDYPSGRWIMTYCMQHRNQTKQIQFDYPFLKQQEQYSVCSLSSVPNICPLPSQQQQQQGYLMCVVTEIVISSF